MTFVSTCLSGSILLHLSASLFVFPSAYMPVIYYSCAGFIAMFVSIAVSSVFASLCILFLSLSESFIDRKPKLKRRLNSAKNALTAVSNFNDISKKNVKIKLIVSYASFIGVVVFAPIIIQSVLISLVVKQILRRIVAVFCLQTISNICIFLIVYLFDTQVISSFSISGIFR